MKVYKIQHIPSGLFYQHKKGRFNGQRTHFGKFGKVYQGKKPTLDLIKHYLEVSENQFKKYDFKIYQDYSSDFRILFKEEDWEIVTYNMEELSNE